MSHKRVSLGDVIYKHLEKEVLLEAREKFGKIKATGSSD